MEVSIIVPVYNKETFIEKCLRSALSVDFDSFEVIAVDDESTDQSAAICERLASEDSRLRVFHIPNGGVTGARLYGLQQARGRFVMFVDSDDELLPNALSATYPVIIREEADEVFATYVDQHGRKYSSNHIGTVADTTILIKEICCRTAHFSFAWGILYRKEILEGCLDQAMGRSYAEDKLMQLKVLMKHPKVWFISDTIYLYNADIPNSWRSFTIAKDLEFEEALRRTLSPEWDRLESAFNMHRIKMYERYLENRDFESCRYYQDLRRLKDPSLSLPSRIVISLPQRISWMLVWVYRKYRRLTHKG